MKKVNYNVFIFSYVEFIKKYGGGRSEGRYCFLDF